eukprot:6370264-Lingulodinium_polyedra.AAC.1
MGFARGRRRRNSRGRGQVQGAGRRCAPQEGRWLEPLGAGGPLRRSRQAVQVDPSGRPARAWPRAGPRRPREPGRRRRPGGVPD